VNAPTVTIDFFEGQERARKNTGKLVLFFGLAVLLMIVGVFAIVCIAMKMSDAETQAVPFMEYALSRLDLLGMAAVGVLVVVGLGSMVKTASLKAGGHVIAESLGGSPILPGTNDPDAARLLNVVEEVAIASGSPVPPVYLLEDETGINAFAAGYSIDDAVIGVTRGCVELLTRDELQGVIAHEFSHILNGDMRLNIRLIGIVAGILFVAMVGYIAMRVGMVMGHGRRRSKESGGAAIGLLAAGAALWVLGYAGVFFGRLIKAAVSRQREYLADASSVQFTRNPDGIAGALKKIGGFSEGSHIQHPRGEEASHMMFSQGFRSFFGGLFATHPPLEERIRRVDPSFVGKFDSVTGPPPADQREAVAGFAAQATTAVEEPPLLRPAVAMIGEVDPAHIDYARQMMANIPDRLREAAREPFAARPLVYALLMSPEENVNRRQREDIGQSDVKAYHEMGRLEADVASLDDALRLPLADLAVEGLRGMAKGQYDDFRAQVNRLIEADENVDLFEWSLTKILLRHLDPQFLGVKRRSEREPLRDYGHHVSTLLTALAIAGADSQAEARTAFAHGQAELTDLQLEFVPTEANSLTALDDAANRLSLVRPKDKRRVVHAAAQVISADREITLTEAELFRAVVDTLGCPVPPLLPGQPIGAA